VHNTIVVNIYRIPPAFLDGGNNNTVHIFHKRHNTHTILHTPGGAKHTTFHDAIATVSFALPINRRRWLIYSASTCQTIRTHTGTNAAPPPGAIMIITYEQQSRTI